MLGVVYRTISSHLLRKSRLTRTAGAAGAVTLIQGFGSALNLNIHCVGRHRARQPETNVGNDQARAARREQAPLPDGKRPFITSPGTGAPATEE